MLTLADIRTAVDTNPYAAALALVVAVIVAVSIIYITAETLWVRFGPTEPAGPTTQGWLDEDTEVWHP